MIICVVFSAAFPSPYGDFSGSGFLFSSVAFMAVSIWCFSMPTTSANPASTASGRSVESRITSTGFLIGGAVASSWIPPESVTINSHFFISIRKSR